MKYYIFSLLLLGLASVAPAQEKPIETATIKLRVTGLFSPDRVDDLKQVMSHIPDARLVSVDYDQAEAVFEYDVNQSFDKAKPDKVPDRLDNAVRTNSRSTFSIKPLSTTPKEKLQKLEIGVLGLDCKGCALGAYESVARIDGVDQATVNFKEGIVKAQIDPEKTNREALEAALVKARVELKKSPEAKP
jgi:copper chaperone CopZ